MNKNILASSIALGIIALSVAPAFAQTSMGAGAHMMKTGTSTSASITTKIACIGAAVNAREVAIDSAVTAFTSADNAAYAARATALGQAYTQTTLSAVKTGVKAAWATFSSSEKTARTAWKTARDAAWSQYHTAAMACKAPTGTGDSMNSTSEASGH